MSHDESRNVLDAAADRHVAPGLDHDWFEFSPIGARPALSWPDSATVAVSVVLDLGAVEWESPDRVPVVPPNGGRGIHPYPDFPRMSHREFGHRVGIFRLLDLLAGLDITPAAAVDVLTVERYAPLLPHLDEVVGEHLAHGLSASRPVTSRMGAEEENDYVRETLRRLAAGLGRRPSGWLSPEHSESVRTPEILAAHDVTYVADWANDDQPYPMTGVAGELWSYPLSWELSDLSSTHLRGLSADDYGRAIIEAVDTLADEGKHSGRMLGLHLHPWLSGQPFRAGAVEVALEQIRSRSDVWLATPGEVVAWCRRQASEDGDDPRPAPENAQEQG